MQGKKNIEAGFQFPVVFMVYGFVLIYLGDFATALHLNSDGERS